MLIRAQPVQRFDGAVPSSRAEQLLQMRASSRGKSCEVDGLEHSFGSIILNANQSASGI